MPLRIGHLSTFYHTAILLMARQDLCGPVAAELDWRLFGTGPAIMQAFGRGELDLAYIGLPPAIIGIAKGIDVVCVAGGHQEGTVMAGKSSWNGYPEHRDLGVILGQFAGKRIGVPGSGSIHDVILKDSLERYGLTGSVTVVNYPWADLVTEAVAKDEAAAAFGTPALAAAIRRFAGGKILYPPALLWPGNPSYGIIAARSFLQGGRELLGRFLAAHERAEEVLRNEPASAAEAIAGQVGIIDPAFVLETIRISPRYCAQLTDRYIAATLAFVKALRKLGYIDREPGIDEIFDASIIAHVHPAGDHYGPAPA